MTDSTSQPLIPAQQRLPEITFKVVIIGIILAVLLAAANTYLALKIGMLTSASIPAAVIAMGILRFFKNSNILENNLIQTCASAGEAIAGGVVYTVPALIIIHYWLGFNYYESIALGLIGSISGVLFSIPLRKILVTNPDLRFPEGQAIAEVLKFNLETSAGFKELLLGGLVGGLVELTQTGFKVVSSNIHYWFMRDNTLFGFGVGFSATMIGAGYIIGIGVGISILIGAIISSLLCLPYLSHSSQFAHQSVTQMVSVLWDSKIRYIGVGAMLTAGLWTLLNLLKPFWISIKTSWQVFTTKTRRTHIPRTEYDMPLIFVITGIVLLSVWMAFLFANTFHLSSLGLASNLHIPFIVASIFYVVFFGFIFAAICGYFSGLVGVSASPGSAVIIAGMLLAAIGIRLVLSLQVHVTHLEMQQAAAITIMIGAIITGAACIANDNIQDLKVGHILGATPWKQQIMLLLGAVVAALVIPLIMQLLYSVYGIAGAFPHAGMNHADQLPAPPAAVMATITQGVFHDNLPWNLVGVGALIIIACICINELPKMNRKKTRKLSILGIAIGMYLPLATSTALFLGSLISYITHRGIQRQSKTQSPAVIQLKKHRGLLLACGLVAGAAIMDVIIAVPLALAHNPNILVLMPNSLHLLASFFGVIIFLMLAAWMIWTSLRN